jgi:uncharacterized protein YkwD
MKKHLFFAIFFILSFVGYGRAYGASPPSLTNYEWEVVALTNKQRLKEGLLPVGVTNYVQKAADTRADEISIHYYKDHTRLDGSSCFTVLKELGVTYRMAGENIAAGFETPSQVVKAWMESEGHRKNIMNGDFNQLGAGYKKAKSSVYLHHWTQMFLNMPYPVKDVQIYKAHDGVKLSSKGIDGMHLLLVVNYKNGGEAFIPIVKEMCKGYQGGSKPQTVSVVYGDFNATLHLNPEDAAPIPPPEPPQKGEDQEEVLEALIVPETVKVVSIELSDGEVMMPPGALFQLKTLVIPLNATDRALRYESVNTAVATVDQNGLIRARNVGDTKVHITSQDGLITGVCEVKIAEFSELRVMGLETEAAWPNEVVLRWDEIPTASYYEIYRSMLSYTGFKKVGESRIGEYGDAGLICGDRYYYYVKAVRPLESSKDSARLALQTRLRDFEIEVSIYPESVRVTFDRIAGANVYRIQRTTGYEPINGVFQTIATLSDFGSHYEFIDQQVKDGVNYVYRVVAERYEDDIKVSSVRSPEEKVYPDLLGLNLMRAIEGMAAFTLLKNSR